MDPCKYPSWETRGFYSNSFLKCIAPYMYISYQFKNEGAVELYMEVNLSS